MIDLTGMPPRILKLPRDPRGYPIPWFVLPHDPVDFRVLRGAALQEAIGRQICWVCGDPLGAWKVFVIGPLGALQAVTHEGACHHECAEAAVTICPFIASPRMQRNPREIAVPDTTTIKVYYEGNPGMYALWVTHGSLAKCKWSMQAGTPILHLPVPEEVHFYRERRLATRDETAEVLDQAAMRLRDAIGADKDAHIAKLLRVAHDLLPEGDG